MVEVLVPVKQGLKRTYKVLVLYDDYTSPKIIYNIMQN